MPRRIIVAKQLFIQPLNDQAIALDMNDETYYTLNGSAAHMWQVLTNTATINEAIQQLLAYYDVDEKVLRKEVEVFLDKLCQHQFIEISDD